MNSNCCCMFPFLIIFVCIHRPDLIITCCEEELGFNFLTFSRSFFCHFLKILLKSTVRILAWNWIELRLIFSIYLFPFFNIQCQVRSKNFSLASCMFIHYIIILFLKMNLLKLKKQRFSQLEFFFIDSFCNIN